MTFRTEPAYEVTEDGFLPILSGVATNEPSATAGVGFFVTPACCHCYTGVSLIYQFLQKIFPHDVVEHRVFGETLAQGPPT